MTKRKVFILGGGGFIGFSIAKILSVRKNFLWKKVHVDWGGENGHNGSELQA